MNKIFLVAALALLPACVTTVYQPVVATEVCGWTDVPIYKTVTRPASSGEIAVGALVGGVIGDVVSNGDDGSTVLGAIVGGALASGPYTERVIVGYRTEWQCNIVYK